MVLNQAEIVCTFYLAVMVYRSIHFMLWLHEYEPRIKSYQIKILSRQMDKGEKSSRTFIVKAFNNLKFYV